MNSFKVVTSVFILFVVGAVYVVYPLPRLDGWVVVGVEGSEVLTTPIIDRNIDR